MSRLGDDILQGLKEAVAYKRGDLTEADGVKKYQFPQIPQNVNVKEIRSNLGLTQEEFAQFGFSVRAIQNWENNKRRPEGAARVLLKIIAHHPKMVLDTLKIQQL
jgi:putative transcriptional regulator